MLAQELARLTGAKLCVDALVRRNQTPMLGGMGAHERERIMAGAIAVNPARAGRISGARVLLLDDVLTSGATTDACVFALKAAGAERAMIACFARVLDEALEHRAEKWEPVVRN